MNVRRKLERIVCGARYTFLFTGDVGAGSYYEIVRVKDGRVQSRYVPPSRRQATGWDTEHTFDELQTAYAYDGRN